MSTAPLRSTLDVFREDLFVGKVLFITGGGTGIVRAGRAALRRAMWLETRSLTVAQRVEGKRKP